jgi:CheY-like chemotaxis protein
MKKILLIDDDPLFVLLARKILESIAKPLTVDVCADGELAITYIAVAKEDQKSLPDLIFLDLNMPVLDGWGFLEAYSAMQAGWDKRIDIYILSSTISTDDITHAARFPFLSGFLIKPIEKSKMEKIILA